MADWVTISALASAGGRLVLAGVTVGSVRSVGRHWTVDRPQPRER